MRVVELRVDGQRVSLSSEDRVLHAIERGDLKIDTRVIITEDGDEVFVGEAGKAPLLSQMMARLLVENAPPAAEAAAWPAAPFVDKQAADPRLPVVTVQAGAGVSGTPAPLADAKVTMPRQPLVKRGVGQGPPAVLVQPGVTVPVTPAFVSPEPVTAAPLSDAPIAAAWRQPVAPSMVSDPPKPWRHFWAKQIDVPLTMFVAAIGWSIVFAANDAYNYDLIPFLAWLSFIPLDALSMSVFGTTVGKALFRIRVTNKSKKLNIFSSLARSFRAYVFGAFVGLPILSFIAMASAMGSMKQLGASAWDVDAGNVVTYGKIGFGAGLLIFVLFASIALMTIVGMTSS
ncbi:RDD family protein [Brevundimonas sp.]|uniref:RDD family protein n=1 Tax=Brevundimonas sp. TaxID=1871086 RepID=UPI0028A26412|nr:RDD family protein [Brevundimonas sp.]